MSDNYKNRKRFWLHVLVGAVISVGGILPGVSGSVMAVSLGLYKPMIDAFAGFFKAPRKNFLFLLPIGIGASVGFLLGAFITSRVLELYYDQVMYLFLGLVAGGIPSFLKEANERGFKRRYLFATLAGALAASLMLLLDSGASSAGTLSHLTPVKALISGGIVSAGVVFPGVSTAFILIYLGWYKPMMDAFANFDVVTLLFLGLGAAVCGLSTVKAARWLFERFHGYAYYGVLGFLIVSAALIFPGFALTSRHFLCVGLAVIGFAGAYLLGKISI